MQRGRILDAVVVAIVLYSIVRGWQRRTLKVVASLVALLAGLLLAPFLASVGADVVGSFIDADVNSRRALALAGSLIVIDAIIAVLAHRKTRDLELSGPVLLDRFAGAMMGAIRGVVIATLVMFGLLALSAGADDMPGFAQGVGESVSGDVLTAESSPIAIGLDLIVARTDDMRALSLWVRQQTELRISVPGDRLTFDGSEDVQHAEDAERALLEMLNAERIEAGLDPLGWCEACARVARAHASDMYRNGYFSHVDLDGDDPFERLREADIGYRAAGENLAIAPDAEVAHQGLMRSPDHRENLLRSVFDEVGIGVFDGPYGLIAAQLFRDAP